MGSLAGDFSVLAGMLGLLVFLLCATLKINRNRKVRGKTRRVTNRLLNWK